MSDSKLPDKCKSAIVITCKGRLPVTDGFKIQQVLSGLAIAVVYLDAIERKLHTQPNTILPVVGFIPQMNLFSQSTYQ